MLGKIALLAGALTIMGPVSRMLDSKSYACGHGGGLAPDARAGGSGWQPLNWNGG